jgi:prolyl oligopeptidase
MTINYPQTRREDFVEEIHGLRIPDPYRWMENLEDDEIRGWIEAQNKNHLRLFRVLPLAEENPGAHDGIMGL